MPSDPAGFSSQSTKPISDGEPNELPMARSITYTALSDIPLVQPGDDVVGIVKAGLAAVDIALQDGDVLPFAR
jgi:hypothetical protein